MKQKILSFVRSLTTQQLFLYLIFLSFIFMGVWAVFMKLYPAQVQLKLLFLSISSFLWGCLGLVIVLRKESPPPWAATGSEAVIYGLIIILLAWPISILSIIKMFSQ